MNNHKTKNPVVRDGVAQQQRHTAALAPGSVQIDQYDLADFLVFIYRLSERINYYNDDNKPDGNWQDFFERSTPVQLAIISKTNPQEIQAKYNDQVADFFDSIEVNKSLSAARSKLETLFNTCTEVFNSLQIWYDGLDNTVPLKATIKVSVRCDLDFPIHRLYRYRQIIFSKKEIIQVVSEMPGAGDSSQTVSENYDNYSTLFESTLFKLISPLRQGSSVSSSTTEPSRNDSLFTIEQLLRNPIQAHDELDSIFQPLFQVYSQIIEFAKADLPDSLKANQEISPHIALCIAFWDMFKSVQGDLNKITEKHLNFFYRDVLGFSERKAQPDKAHLIFELAKFQTLHKLERNTQFSAGTDAAGVDLIYSLDEDIIVNQAKIVELKGIFLDNSFDQEISDSNQLNQKLLGLHVSPIVNSPDGKGGSFSKANLLKEWLPFGDSSRVPAQIGLAIASNTLLLREGDRTITFKFTLSFPSIPIPQYFLDYITHQPQKVFHIDFSSEKDWVNGNIVINDQKTYIKPLENSDYELQLNVHLPIDFAAVDPYHSELSGPNLKTNYPVARLFLRPESYNEIAAYHYLSKAELQALKITVKVDGIRNVLLQNDISTLDSTKPFPPFGPQPKTGATLYIGSQEVFQKHLTALNIAFELDPPPPTITPPSTPDTPPSTLDTPPPKNENAQPTSGTVNWAKIYAAYGVDQKGIYEETKKQFDPGKLAIHALRDRQWHPNAEVIENNLFPKQLPPDNTYNINLTNKLGLLNLNGALNEIDGNTPLQPWTYESKYGFLRLQLTGDAFLHDKYPVVLARQVLATATQEIINSDGDKRKAVIGAYYASSAADHATISPASSYYVEPNAIPILPGEPYTPIIKSLKLSYTATATQDNCQLFHLHPFDGFVSLSQGSDSYQSILERSKLLPQFSHEGELLIGLQDIEPASTLSLLFQIAEETADINQENHHVSWYYLKDNDWQEIDEPDIRDSSHGLTHTGIVKLTIPEDISNAHTTILTTNRPLHWIKASAQIHSEAVGHIISIHPQAATVTLDNPNTVTNHLSKPLAKERITKFVTPQPEVKQIQQPYHSFAGRVKEPSSHFYTRVSEYLRHKGRAVTIFDYERLVLEHFPEIYKVRCINHGKVIQKVVNELVPGSVTVVVIPALSQKVSINHLEPKVNTNVLYEIQDYLKSVSSPWVDLQVVNPKYEKIYIQFWVKFHEPYHTDFRYYAAELRNAIASFLAPWTTEEGSEIHFYGAIYRSSLLEFIKKQFYVDYIVVLDLYHQDEHKVSKTKIVARTVRSILVPDPEKINIHRVEDLPAYVDELPAYREEIQADGELGLNPLSTLQLGLGQAADKTKLGNELLSRMKLGE